MFKRKCKITFISHGATIHSDENRFSDKDKYPPLNDIGEQEIENICSWLKKRAVKNDKIYSSSALRTVQSAQIIADAFQEEFEIIKELSPRKMGVLSGLSHDEAEEKYPDVISKIYENPCSFSPEGAETIVNFNKRIIKTIKKIVDENKGNRLIIVTHPDVIQSVIASSIGIPAKNQPKIYIKTGSATQISFYEKWTSLVYSGYIPI